MADRSTLFLDEVGELTHDMQVSLLRVLEEGEFERLGAAQTRKVNVRLIAATNRSLDQDVCQGVFRSDLFYRLSVFPIHLPPLRERIEDIPLLVEHFLKRFAARLSKPVPRVSPEALALLLSHPWPGNIRELENLVERAVLLAES